MMLSGLHQRGHGGPMCLEVGNFLRTTNVGLLAGGSDTQSEVSSSGTDDLRDLAILLGASIEELCQDRFRVDRRRLEQMIHGEPENPADTAESFFQNIMEETNTYITWPSKLKIGAKSKKDPHVRICGRPLDVKAAKQRVMEALDTRATRVTMKLDVSYTEHSHIIGRGGLTIKKVMEETRCHIHFPDSNRSNPVEKSNQVSIAGNMDGVEQARSRVRELTPLIFSFELPVLGASQPVPDNTSPYVMEISEKYNVQVMFRTRPKLHATLVVVKGQECELYNVKSATMLLIKHMCDVVANQISVQMTIEISPQHHAVVLGAGSMQLKGIMNRTSTQIMFPDASDPNIPPIKRSCVTIIGNIDSVYIARQQLLGSLPLVLMFDLPEDMPPIDTDYLTKLMNSLEVFINVRHKPKQNTLSVIIKGIERCASNIYDARHRLLKLQDSARVVASIPNSYNIPPGESHHLAALSSAPMSPISPVPWQQLNTPFSYNMASMNPSRQLNNKLMPPPGLMLPPMHHHGMMRSGPLPANLSHNSSGYQSYCGSNSSIDRNVSSAPVSPRQSPPHSDDAHNIISKSIGTGSLGDLTLNIQDIHDMQDRRAPGFEKMQADNSISSPDHISMSSSTSISPMYHATQAFDYEQKKRLANQAMQSKPSGEMRVPTSLWSGLGFSQTSPGLIKPILEDDNIWSPSANSINPLGLTSALDYSPSSVLERRHHGNGFMQSNNGAISTEPESDNDLTSLLCNIGLEKYNRLFSSHEIDLTTFCSLSEYELIQIGVTAWGARRRMLTAAAAQVNNTRGPIGFQNREGNAPNFSGSAAPGAERRSNSSDGW